MKTREQLEATGNKILNSVRTELYLSMRFMGPALGSLGFAMDLSTRTVGTDAVYIRFNPTYLLQTYIERPEILNRTYMHMLMHCLFRHMFSAKQHEDAQLWDLCCDIAVESVVDSMDYPTILRVTSDFRQEWYEKLEKAEQQLDNLRSQQEAAQAELGKPFPQEAELAEKSARLAELDALLNMDDRGNDDPDREKTTEKPSVLAELRDRAGRIPPMAHRDDEEVAL